LNHAMLKLRAKLTPCLVLFGINPCDVVHSVHQWLVDTIF
jgi:hypothetical protein